MKTDSAIDDSTKTKKKRKITKEELKELLKLRDKTIRSKERIFRGVCEGAHEEWVNFHPCDKCKFLKKECHKTCGIIMKWKHKEGLVAFEESFGNSNRIVSALESGDTTSVNLGVAEEIELYNKNELDGAFNANNDISLSDIDSYDIDDSNDDNGDN